MKIIALSDSHGKFDCLDKIISAESPFDCLIHCGDGISDLDDVLLPGGSSLICVTGNVDSGFNSKCPDMRIEVLSGMRIMITHGDIYSVKSGLKEIQEAGIANKSDLILFGHTHKQYLKIEDDIILFNPGPCMDGFYGIIDIDKTAEFKHKQIIC